MTLYDLMKKGENVMDRRVRPWLEKRSRKNNEIILKLGNTEGTVIAVAPRGKKNSVSIRWDGPGGWSYGVHPWNYEVVN